MFTVEDVGPKYLDGKEIPISNAEKQAIVDQWNDPPSERELRVRIARERERRLNTSIIVTLSDGDYTIPVTDRSVSWVPHAARRARMNATTRPFPTDKGIVELSADDLERIEYALDAYTSAVWRRAGELERMVVDGTITEDDLNAGWPRKE